MFLDRVISRYPVEQWYRMRPQGSGFAVLDSDGNSFNVTRDVLDKDGNTHTVSGTVLDSDGNGFVVI